MVHKTGDLQPSANARTAASSSEQYAQDLRAQEQYSNSSRSLSGFLSSAELSQGQRPDSDNAHVPQSERDNDFIHDRNAQLDVTTSTHISTRPRKFSDSTSSLRSAVVPSPPSTQTSAEMRSSESTPLLQDPSPSFHGYTDLEGGVVFPSAARWFSSSWTWPFKTNSKKQHGGVLKTIQTALPLSLLASMVLRSLPAVLLGSLLNILDGVSCASSSSHFFFFGHTTNFFTHSPVTTLTHSVTSLYGFITPSSC